MTNHTRHRYCAACGTQFDARTTGVYCSNDCRKGVQYRPTAFRPIIACSICGAMFKRFNLQHKTCSSECRAKHTYQRRSGRIKAAPSTKRPVIPVITGVPCASCTRGVESEVSDTGWECSAHLAMLCKPLGNSPVHHTPIA